VWLILSFDFRLGVAEGYSCCETAAITLSFQRNTADWNIKVNAYKTILYTTILGLTLSTVPALAEMMQVGGLRAGDTLNVRTGAGANFTDVGDLQDGEIINVLGIDTGGKWAQIIYRGRMAYVSVRYLHTVTRTDGGSTSTGRHWVTGIKAGDPDGGLVVRSGSGRNFASVGVLADGAEAHVIQRSADGKWAMIAFGSGIGWVSSAYLRSTNPHGAASPQPLPPTAPQTGAQTGTQIGPEGLPLPAVYTVSGVAANDVLWVRAEPTTFSARVDNLAPNVPVVVLGMATDGWVLVSVGQNTGYVNARFLTRGGGVTTSSGLQMNILCRGTEPFWSLDIDQDRTVTYTMAGTAAQYSALNQATPSPLTGSYPYTIAANPVSGVVGQEICSDGMSDIQYPWSILLNAPNEAGVMATQHGCCTLR